MSIQVFILSQLMKGNTYPYKLKKQISEPIRLDELGGITESKLYYHFDALTKQGLIETVEIIKEAHRPDKQVFAITTKGRAELPNKIYKLFESADNINDMVMGLVNIKYVDREQIVKILDIKLEKFKARWEHIMEFEKVVEIDEDNEKITKFLGQYFSTKADHTIYWLEEAIKQIKNEEI